MDSSIIVQLAVYGAFGLIALGILAMLFAGFKSMAQGKQDYKRIGLMAVPFVVFGVSYGVLSDVTKAGVMTTLVMMGIMVGSIVITGLRGTFKF
jgi:hypothetical protein